MAVGRAVLALAAVGVAEGVELVTLAMVALALAVTSALEAAGARLVATAAVRGVTVGVVTTVVVSLDWDAAGATGSFD